MPRASGRVQVVSRLPSVGLNDLKFLVSVLSSLRLFGDPLRILFKSLVKFLGFVLRSLRLFSIKMRRVSKSSVPSCCRSSLRRVHSFDLHTSRWSERHHHFLRRVTGHFVHRGRRRRERRVVGVGFPFFILFRLCAPIIVRLVFVLVDLTEIGETLKFRLRLRFRFFLDAFAVCALGQNIAPVILLFLEVLFVKVVRAAEG
mmetsp:Transcript_11275/g.21557  ORF Transcript_11275/g.21557 Transcript_11275/m.21557 type:complete len:201 (-) Transcript_11275:375-977(-)